MDQNGLFCLMPIIAHMPDGPRGNLDTDHELTGFVRTREVMPTRACS